MADQKTVWCWYTEGGSFTSGFRSKREALEDAILSEIEPSKVLIGTEIGVLGAMAGIVDAQDLADHLAEELNVEDCGAYLRDGAQEALEAWVHEYVECDMSTVCLNGEHPTQEEIAEVSDG